VYRGHYQLKIYTNYTASLITYGKVGAKIRARSHVIYLWSNTNLPTLGMDILKLTSTKETSKPDLDLQTECYHPSVISK